MLGKTEYEQNQHAKPMSMTMKVAITGFFGGVFWSFIGWAGYVFHFTEIRPNTVLEPWAVGEWKTMWIGTVISLFLIGLFGILAAFVYYFLLKNYQNIWIGLVYGMLLFLLVFFVFNPLFPGLNHITELKRDTMITTICLYLLFGMFVGYTISYEYNEKIQHHKPEKTEAEHT